MEQPPRGRFTDAQTEVLLRAIKPHRIYQTQGHSNLAAWDVVAHLTRMFGFGGWEKEILELTLVWEARGGELGLPEKKGWYVTYRCQLRLRVFDEVGLMAFQTDDVATGSAQNQPQLGDAHDLASKNAVSYALKRCAKDLGDQFGLSLYRDGTAEPVVRSVVGHSAQGDEPAVEGEGESDQRYQPGEAADSP